MLKFRKQLKYALIALFLSVTAYSSPIIYVNQVGFNPKSPKIAIIEYYSNHLSSNFDIIDADSGKTVFTSKIGKAESVNDWKPNTFYYKS